MSLVCDSERQTKLPWEMRQFKVTFQFGKRTHPVHHSDECFLHCLYHLINSSESGSCTSSILIYFLNWWLHQCFHITHTVSALSTWFSFLFFFLTHRVLPVLIHVANTVVGLWWHTAWPRTSRPWRRTSSSKIKAVLSSVLLGKRAGCCFKTCWSATSSPRSLSLAGDSSPLRAKRTKTWLVGWFDSIFHSVSQIHQSWELHFAWRCVICWTRCKRWWTLRSLMIMQLLSRVMMWATAAWEQPEQKQGL